MAPDTGSPTPDPRPLRLRLRGSLTRRILAVNLVTLALIAGLVFALDGFRNRLIVERRKQAEEEVQLVAALLARTPLERRVRLLHTAGSQSDEHFRLFDRQSRKLIDSWEPGPPSFTLIDPDREPWQRRVARAVDRAVDALVGADVPPPFVDSDDTNAWPEIAAVKDGVGVSSRVRLAPDRTFIVSAAARSGGDLLLSVDNARDVRRLIRAERGQLMLVILAALVLSGSLSFFLARTIVRPLRRLARAAVRVRLGRDREVVVPVEPSRRDEIGVLSRAVSDMTATLRVRIDATEAFAADVAHELKNPLASMRSALDSFERVEDPALRAQLLGILRDDVQRLDRLITDISDISRLDGQLTRAPFPPVDLGELIERLVAQHQTRAPEGGPRLALARPPKGLATVAGDAGQLARAIDNLIDNALSFSPPAGLVRVGATRTGDTVIVQVDDEGPGVPESARRAIFGRFHSDRPGEDSFGRHSGLGLAIAKAIVDGHGGTIEAIDPETHGARFVIRLAAA